MIEKLRTNEKITNNLESPKHFETVGTLGNAKV